MTLSETPSCATEFLLPGERPLAPGEDRLLQVRHPGDAAGHELPQLVDHRRRGRVNPVLIRDPQPDQRPVALGNGLEVHGVGGGDVVEPGLR